MKKTSFLVVGLVYGVFMAASTFAAGMEPGVSSGITA